MSETQGQKPSSAASSPAPSPSPSSLSVFGMKLKLPSRGWLLFGAVVTVAGTALAYDKHQLEQQRKQLRERALAVGTQPLAVDALARRLVVVVEPTHWARYWVRQYVKPVLDAAAIDYVVVEPSHAARARAVAADALWAAHASLRDQSIQRDLDLARAAEKARFDNSWLGALRNFFFVKAQEERKRPLPPAFTLPKYDPSVGIVAVGPLVWRNVLLGIQDGACLPPPAGHRHAQSDLESIQNAQSDPQSQPPELFPAIKASSQPFATIGTDSDSGSNADPFSLPVLLPPSVEFPPIGYITGKDQSGFVGFPSRVAGFFNERSLAASIGEETLKIVMEHTRPFVRGVDELLGSEDLVSIPPPKTHKNGEEVKQETLKLDDLCRDAHKLTALNPQVAERIRVYA
eukprot:jgi/Hompol1/1215/HPOL_001057-RA